MAKCPNVHHIVMYLTRWKRAAILLLLVWIGVTYVVISPLSSKCPSGADGVVDYDEQLRRVSSQLDSLRREHAALQGRIRKAAGGDLQALEAGSFLLDVGNGPPEDYENLRRRVYTNTKEFWNYISNELAKVKREGGNAERIQDILEQAVERKRSLIVDQERLREVDSFQEWRELEAANVSELVQRRLRRLQNPPDCRAARKVVCNLNKGCGFGCQLHHVVYCIIFAYASERTLILNSKGWRYNTKGWESVFEPLSETCTSAYDDKVTQWPGEASRLSYDAKVVSLPFIDSIAQKPKFLPLAIPKDLAHRIVRFNGDPASWWIGQIVKFVFKPRPAMQKAINDTIEKIGFKTPIVGVHVRRTDKIGTEAALHHIHEYMAPVAEYYNTRELVQPVDVRRVYIASDDANVLGDARRKYPDYEFIGDPSISKTADTYRRYNPHSLVGLLVDLQLLSRSDFLVCTFSSQVGRVAYEMMQANRIDASDSYVSLDDTYYYGGQNGHDRRAVIAHKRNGKEEIEFETGDLIGVAGNHWNGFGRGTNRRTNVNGLFPWYKTVDHLVLYPFPEYKHVPLYSDIRQES